MTTPTVSVLLCVYNGERFVAEAVESILAQSYGNFEFVVINDGSTDKSRDVVAQFRDPRIRIVDHVANLGLIASLNHGLEIARGRFVAIMDSDDRALPQRLERQAAYLEAHTDVTVCGSAMQLIGERTGPGWVRYFAPDAISTALLFENPMCHPTVMHNREGLRRLNLTYPSVLHAEDYALWAQVARRGKIANLPEALLEYRVHPEQISHRRSERQADSMRRVIREQLAALGIVASGQELLVHQLLGSSFTPLPAYERRLKAWVRRLVAANARAHVYEPAEFEGQLTSRVEAAVVRVNRTLRAMSLLRRLKWRVTAWRNFVQQATPQAASSP